MKHRHHIIPRHMGGKDSDGNIELLTVEEHAEAHRKLYEEHGHWQDRLAWQGLSGMIGKEELMQEIYKNRVPHNKGKKQPFRKRRPMSEETKEKIARANTGRKMTTETRQKMSEAAKGRVGPNTGRKFSDETRKKMSESAKKRWSRT